MVRVATLRGESFLAMMPLAARFVRWESHNGKYSGQWKPWRDGTGAQYVGRDDDPTSLVQRGAIAITGVKFTQKEVHATGGYFRLNAATKNKLGSCEDAEYGNYK
mgnify:CR=1 FL=1